MATVSTPAASIAIPNDVSAFAANVSPRGVDLDQRLDLSLDALIKERKKEQKLQKKEEAKKQKKEETKKLKPQEKRKPVQQQRKQKPKQSNNDVKNGQKAQRKALVNKNRGLPALPAAPKGKAQQVKTKTSIAATTARLRRQMRAAKMAQNSQRLVVSPKAVKGVNQNKSGEQSKKKKNQVQPRKTVAPARVVQQKIVKQPVKQQAKASVKTPGRQVTRSSNKKVKLSITIPGSSAKENKKAHKKQANKVLLPGKVSQSLANHSTTAKKMVKRSKNRKMTSGNVTHVVRQVGQRKKH